MKEEEDKGNKLYREGRFETCPSVFSSIRMMKPNISSTEERFPCLSLRGSFPKQSFLKYSGDCFGHYPRDDILGILSISYTYLLAKDSAFSIFCSVSSVGYYNFQERRERNRRRDSALFHNHNEMVIVLKDLMYQTL